MKHGINRTDSREAGALLRAAAGRGDESEVHHLLETGAVVDARDEAGYTALMRAAYARQAEIIRLLLAAGADVNARSQSGETALIGAALGGSVEVVRLLLDVGADVYAEDTEGLTALKSAQLQHPTEDDPGRVVEFCELIDLLQAAQTGICI